MSRMTANALMLLTAFIWGTTFVAQQLGMNSVGPLTYTGARFLIGATVVLPLAWREWQRLTAAGVRITGLDLAKYAGLGVLLFLGAVFQQIGIAGTSVSNSGFLTALYVPLVPILGWMLGHPKPHWAVWPAIAASLIGTFMLSGGHLDALNHGDYWVILSTLFWAGHVLFVGVVAAEKGAPIVLACVQFIVCGLLACAAAPMMEVVTISGLRDALWAILYGGLLSVGIAFTLQVVAQRHTPAADAALLLSSEILFAALAGAIYLGERLTPLQLAGGALIFTAMVAVQLVPLFEQRRPAAESA